MRSTIKIEVIRLINILVVEDDTNTNKLLCAMLKRHGYNVCAAADGVAALEVMDHQNIDLAVVDVMMPRMDGLELTRQIRAAFPGFPILMVTAKQQPDDKRQGFLAGTDDYITKPFDEEELMLRIGALLRRARISNERKLNVGGVELDYDALSVTRGGKAETLPQKEFYLLFKLLSYPDTIFTRLQLMDEIWGMDSESDDHTVNVHINRLRERFQDTSDFEIVTVRGLGYKAVKNA